jgi:hypothetical protein
MELTLRWKKIKMIRRRPGQRVPVNVTPSKSIDFVNHDTLPLAVLQ